VRDRWSCHRSQRAFADRGIVSFSRHIKRGGFASENAPTGIKSLSVGQFEILFGLFLEANRPAGQGTVVEHHSHSVIESPQTAGQLHRVDPA